MSTAIAEFHQVVKDYPTGILRRHFLRALNDVSLSIRQGEIFGLVGPNRAGKTTLVKLLLSLGRPTAGKVLRLGLPATDRRTLARVGYVHENHAFPKYLNATALLEYYGALSLIPHETVKNRVEGLLERVGLADRAKEPISRFSKGMVQRLGVAQSLVNEPDLLVLDEPGEGLDLSGRKLMYDIANDMRDRGRTVLLISHQLAEVEAVCDRVAVISDGKIVRTGSIGELTKDSSSGKKCSLEKALKKYYE